MQHQKRFAVIDLGTNTFHLLIGELDKDGTFLREIYRSRYFIKLAEKGIENLSEEALERGMKALLDFRRQIDHHRVADHQVVALGTAALRTAGNGPAFQQSVKEQIGIEIQIISGGREAELIAKGALLAIPPPAEKVMIMDIGGGSVEFIIADKQQIYWAQSFPIGVAVLYRQFHHHEPITREEIDDINSFLSLQLQPLTAALQNFPTHYLVGAAGTFDVVADHLAVGPQKARYADVNLNNFDGFYKRILHTTREERFAMPEIPDDRADMIVVALVLIDFVLQIANIQALTVSYYSMKEGMMAELISKV